MVGILLYLMWSESRPSDAQLHAGFGLSDRRREKGRLSNELSEVKKQTTRSRWLLTNANQARRIFGEGF
jgi:hypothetical protein